MEGGEAGAGAGPGRHQGGAQQPAGVSPAPVEAGEREDGGSGGKSAGVSEDVVSGQCSADQGERGGTNKPIKVTSGNF